MGGYKKEKYIYSIFFCIWIVFSIEYFTTVDYSVYYYGFEDVNEKWEPLYQLLLYIFRPIGFVAFNSIVAAFEIATFCFMFCLVVPPKYRWIGVLLLVISTQNLLLYMTVKRQFFAMMTSMWIIYFIFYSKAKFKYLYALLVYVCAINIHTSAYVSIIYFALPFLNFRFPKWSIIALFLLYLGSHYLLMSNFSEYLLYFLTLTYRGAEGFYEIYINEISDYEDDRSSISLILFLYQTIYFLLLLCYNKKCDFVQRKMFLCSIIGLFLTNILVGNLYRIGFYFTVFHIFSIPILLQHIQVSGMKKLASIFIVLCLLVPIKQYVEVFSGAKINALTAKYQYFYTIFHDNPDKRRYDFLYR